ncbi:MAG TPA: RDD family protein, partial [Intrasporangium sp.]|nr:RDD family protein [Intrasporangium sp.]
MTAGSPAAPGSRSYAPEETVTGEGVALELPVASLGMRALSGMIDVILHIGLLIGVFTVAGALTEESSDAVSRTGIIVSFVGVLVGVPTVSETLSRGKTLGKLITGLRVVRDDGGPISFRHALTRALVGWVEIYLLTGVPAAISALVTARTKRLGDLAAGT